MTKLASILIAILILFSLGANASGEILQTSGEQKSLEALAREVSQLQTLLVEHEKRILQLERHGLPKTENVDKAESVKPEADPAPDLVVKVTKKSFDSKDIHAGDFSDNIWWDASYKSNLKKGTRSVKGVLQFCDLFGDPNFQIRVTIDDPIPPGSTVEISGVGLEYNQFLDEHHWLRTTQLKDLQAGN
jgi:hypothetical protein